MLALLLLLLLILLLETNVDYVIDKDESITFCSYNIYNNSNVHTKTFVSMCICAVMDLI